MPHRMSNAWFLAFCFFSIFTSILRLFQGRIQASSECLIPPARYTGSHRPPKFFGDKGTNIPPTIPIPKPFSSTRAGNKEKSRGLFAPKQKCSRQTGGDYRDKKRSALHRPSQCTASPYAARCASHRTAVRFMKGKQCQQKKAHILHLLKRGHMEKTPLYI